MDDQGIDRKRGSSVMRTLRLAVLMLIGSAYGFLPEVGNRLAIEEKRLPNAILGATCGLFVEALIRANSKK